jgi:nucleotidyltransferase/DNA polymerase involved in DNA repair
MEGVADAPRTILHVDMDAFYAAVEQRDRPELRGRAVVVGADPRGGRGRGVVSTASYEARRFGVASAMPISQAYRLCPDAVYLPVDMEKYSAVSAEVMAVLGGFTDLVEPVSIDEAFLDVTGRRRTLGAGDAVARALKDTLRAATSLTASVGVAANKLVAKIASDLRKPDGLVVVPPGTEAAFLAPLPVRRLWGIGPRMEERLMKAGIHTIGQLAAQGEAVLERRFGTHGHDLLRLARGLDERPVESGPGQAKSVGQEHTYDRDTADRGVHRRTLLRLCDGVARRLREQQLQAGTVTLKHRDEAFHTVTRATTLKSPTDSSDALFASVWRLLEGLPAMGKVRLLGVYASGFEAGKQLKLDLLGDPGAVAADRVRDAVARRFGDGALTRASLLVYPERREGPRRRSDRRRDG